MRFAIYRGQTLHAVVDSDPGKSPVDMHAEMLRRWNHAGRCVPIVDAAHETAITSRAQSGDVSRAKVRGKSVGAMSMADLRALVHVLAEMNGIEVDP